MYIIFLVEEPSAEAALRFLVPAIVGREIPFGVIFHGKAHLLQELATRLQAYRAWLPDDWRIVVLIDEDREDCVALKERLEQAARSAGMVTRTAAGKSNHFQVLNRVAIEELEAWFFGDIEAVVAAYPRVPRTLGRRKRYRNPDGIAGGTAEALERVLQKAGYHLGGLPPRQARRIAAHMDPNRNRSKSFQVFRDALREMVK